MWKSGIASVIGSSHVATRDECQDSTNLAYCDQDGWLAACVSDGAGTARFAKHGSQITSSMFVREMASVATKVDGKGVGEWLIDEIIQVVLRIRETLRQRQDSTLSDFNCTLVGCLIGPSGGVFVHLGDGLAVGGEFAKSKAEEFIANAWNNVILSEPKNGEYSNETYFITEGRWLANLRITPVGPLDWFLLCSDGGMALAFDGGKPKPRFLGPLLTQCANVQDSKDFNSVINSVLSDERASTVTDDDKSLIVVIRERAVEDYSTIVVECFDTPIPTGSTTRPVASTSGPHSNVNKPSADTGSPPKGKGGALTPTQEDTDIELQETPNRLKLIFVSIVIGLVLAGVLVAWVTIPSKLLQDFGNKVVRKVKGDEPKTIAESPKSKEWLDSSPLRPPVSPPGQEPEQGTYPSAAK